MTITTQGNTIYRDNLLYLKDKAPQLLEMLLSQKPARGKMEAAKNGLPTLQYSLNKECYYLHSRFDPGAEAQKLLQKKNLSADHYVVMGLGLGYHLDKLMDQRDPLSRVLLIEPDLEIAAHSLHAIRWRKLLDCKDFFFLLGTDTGDLPRTLHRFIHMAIFDKLELVELPSETRLMAPFFSKVREIVDNEVRSYLLDFKTRLTESYTVPRNVFRNLPYILGSRPITRLRNVLTGTPGFVVAAGPSLDSNILHLKKIRDRGIIIAVDTALKPLLSRSIQPHFTAIGDPSHKNYLHVQGTKDRVKHFVLAETGVPCQVFKDHRDRLFSLSTDRPVVRILEKYSEPLGTVEAWGTVTSIALDFAAYVGLNPIVFVGQDFAFSHTRNHCRGTSWEQIKLQQSGDLDDLQRFERTMITGNRKVIEVPDIYGNMAYTSERLVLYKNFLSRVMAGHKGTTFINATEGGIFSEIPRMSLYEVLKRYVFNRKPVDIDRLHNLPPLGNRQNLERLQHFLETTATFFRTYLEDIDRALALLEPGKTSDLSINGALALIGQMEVLQRLPYTDDTLEKGELLEMWSPAPTYHFLKAYRNFHRGELNENTVRLGLEIYRKYFYNIKPQINDIAVQLEQSKIQLAQMETQVK